MSDQRSAPDGELAPQPSAAGHVPAVPGVRTAGDGGNGKRTGARDLLGRPRKTLDHTNPAAPRSDLRPLKNALTLALGEQLYRRSMILLRDRIAMCEDAHRLIREVMKRKRPSLKRIEAIRSAFGLTAADVRAFVSETGDRFGQPRRTVQDVNVAGGPTMLKLILHDGEHDGEQAEAADAAGSSDGTGTQH